MIEFYEDYLDLLDIVNLEMAIRPESSLINMMEHMLKYKYNKSKQTASWISTITRSYYELISNNKIKISDFELDQLYQESYKRASKENKLPLELKNNKPEDWTIKSLTDEKFIRDFLNDNRNPNPIYYIEIDKFFNSNTKNNKKKK